MPIPKASKPPADSWRARGGTSSVGLLSAEEEPTREPWTVARKFQAHQRGVCTCTFGKDDRTLFTSSTDSSVRVWSTRDWSLGFTVTPLPPPKGPGGDAGALGQPGGVFCMQISTDGLWLATSLWEGSAQIWDLSLYIASSRKDANMAFKRDPKFASPGYSQPVLHMARKSTGTGEGGGRAGQRRTIANRLSFMQVTKVFHELAMPFSAQCHSFEEPQVRLADGRPVTAASIDQGEGYIDMFTKQARKISEKHSTTHCLVGWWLMGTIPISL